MKNEHKKAPSTVAEIGIHIGYINEKLDNIVEGMKDNPTRTEFAALKADVKELQEDNKKGGDKFVTRKEFAVLGSVAGFIILIGNFLINVFNNIRG